ncbi:MAG: hypothetical protein H6983_05135 [Ectothiorhodospiraceae bacterium]|nr:hypothetical protein [Ectothiorhodospiraceae bacterium]
MTHGDNWGWKARIGMFIVASEAVPEAEWWAMAPPHVSIHAARVSASTPWAGWTGDRTEVELADDLERGARQFAQMRLAAVVIGHSSSSIVGGAGWDDAVVRRLAGMLPPEIAVTTNGLDCQAALRASDVSHPFLVFPAWFGDAVLPKGHAYFAERGFEPAGSMRFDPGRNWRDLPPARLYPEGMGFEQDVESLYRQIRAQCPRDADGVLIAGTGFRCVGIVQALEDDLGRPVISANQASLWHCLRLAGVRTAVAGYGSLFQREPR